MKVVSPITGSAASLVESVDVQKVIAKYRKSGVDVERQFRGIDTLGIYQCPDTGYRFFAPPVIGDASFYVELQKLPEYYLGWKWENDVAEQFIGEGSRLLDVGCGEGIFLGEIRSRKNCSVIGLEFNPDAVAECEKKGLKVFSTPIEDLARSQIGRFDVVTMFQVLEHIEDVRSFLTASIELLKPDGRFIVGVPNSDPWIFGREKYCMLNLPPHHAGLWNAASLAKLSDFFDIDVLEIVPEAPNEEQLNYYADNFFGMKRDNSDNPAASLVFAALGRAFRISPLRGLLRNLVRRRGGSLTGHSIVAVYRKRG